MSGVYVKQQPPESGKKRWSLGRLFRRKSRKSEEESSSSSDEDKAKKGFLRRRKKEEGSKDVTGRFVMQGGNARGRTRGARTQRYLSRLNRESERSQEDDSSWKGSKRELEEEEAEPWRESRESLRTEEDVLREAEDWGKTEEARPPTPPRRKSSLRPYSNLEEALNELEEIYRSLRLGEEEEDTGSLRSDLSRETDDMAWRRMNRRESPSTRDSRELLSRAGSYLLVSPTLSPPPLCGHRPPQARSEPDITLDDVVYRSVSRAINSLRVPDPQPPFGIPLTPPAPASESDYLHARPQLPPAPKPARVPDLVMDDLAFRNLRKDAPTKRKAVRSLSANLSGYILRPELNNNQERKCLGPEEGLRLAQRMLASRRRCPVAACSTPEARWGPAGVETPC